MPSCMPHAHARYSRHKNKHCLWWFSSSYFYSEKYLSSQAGLEPTTGTTFWSPERKIETMLTLYAKISEQFVLHNFTSIYEKAYMNIFVYNLEVIKAPPCPHVCSPPTLIHPTALCISIFIIPCSQMCWLGIKSDASLVFFVYLLKLLFLLELRNCAREYIFL